FHQQHQRLHFAERQGPGRQQLHRLSPLEIWTHPERWVRPRPRQAEEVGHEGHGFFEYCADGPEAALDLVYLVGGCVLASEREPCWTDSITGKKGVPCVYGVARHSSHACGMLSSCSRSSWTSRDFPTPASPTTTTLWPSPSAARSQRSTRAPNSMPRPTKRARRRPAEPSRAREPV